MKLEPPNKSLAELGRNERNAQKCWALRGKKPKEKMHLRFDGLQMVTSEAESHDGFERAERGQPQQIVVRVDRAHLVKRIASETFAVRVHVTAARNVHETFRRTNADRYVAGRERRRRWRFSRRRRLPPAGAAVLRAKQQCRWENPHAILSHSEREIDGLITPTRQCVRLGWGSAKRIYVILKRLSAFNTKNGQRSKHIPCAHDNVGAIWWQCC